MVSSLWNAGAAEDGAVEFPSCRQLLDRAAWSGNRCLQQALECPRAVIIFFLPTLRHVARATNLSPQFLFNARAECEEVKTGRRGPAREMHWCMQREVHHWMQELVAHIQRFA